MFLARVPSVRSSRRIEGRQPASQPANQPIGHFSIRGQTVSDGFLLLPLGPESRREFQDTKSQRIITSGGKISCKVTCFLGFLLTCFFPRRKSGCASLLLLCRFDRVEWELICCSAVNGSVPTWRLMNGCIPLDSIGQFSQQAWVRLMELV